MIFYFSGTGNSEYVARQLSARLGEDLHSIADCINSNTYKFTLSPGESVGWVLPTYSWGPAPVAVAFLEKVAFEGLEDSTYCYMVTTCGDEVGLTAKMWRRAVEKRSMTCHAVLSVQMPNNYILLPGFDVDSKALEDSKRQAAVKRLDEVTDRVAKKMQGDDVVVGPMPWLKSKVVYPLFKKFYMSDKPFAAQPDACTHCGLCVKVCPNRNIAMGDDQLPVWKGNCAMCLSCIHRCPLRAIQYGKQTQNKGRYHY